MQSKNLKFYIFAFLLAVLVSLVGLALSKSVVINPLTNRMGLNSVFRDGWTEENAHIDLSRLPSGMVKAHLFFDSWRPDNKYAQLLVYLCEKPVAEFEVKPDLSDVWIAIPPDCQSGKLEFRVKNPFRSLDNRNAGVRFFSADFRYSLTAALDFDIRAVQAILLLSLIIFAISRLNLSYYQELFSILGICSLAAVSLAFISWDNQAQLLVLGFSVFLIAVGAGIDFRSLGFSLEQKEKDSAKMILLVLLSLLLGAGLRFYQIDFGLPDSYHPDEPRKVSISLRMLRELNFDPAYFLHPSFLLYLTSLTAKIGQLLGLYPELNFHTVHLSGRIVSALAGSLSIPLVFLICRDLFTARVGVLASFAFALSPLAITCSRYMKEDSLLLAFVLFSCWLSVRAVKNGQAKALLLAGFVAGLAAGSKYSGVLAFISVLSAPWLKSQKLVPDWKFLKWALIAGIFVPIGFLFTTPYSIINSVKFISNFVAEKNHMVTGHHKVIISSWSQYWMYHMSRSLPPAVSWPVLILGLLGFGTILREKKFNGLFILGLFLTFYLPAEAVNAKPPPQPERYIFPCIPFLIIAAAMACDGILRSRKKLVMLVAVAAMLLSPAYRSLGLARELVPDTRVLMRDWIYQNIPAGSSIMIDAQAYSAFLDRNKFKVETIVSIPDRRSMTLENLQRQGVEYLLLTSPSYERYFLTRSADQIIRERFDAVFRNWTLMKEMQSDFGYYGFHNPTLRLYKVELKDG